MKSTTQHHLEALIEQLGLPVQTIKMTPVEPDTIICEVDADTFSQLDAALDELGDQIMWDMAGQPIATTVRPCEQVPVHDRAAFTFGTARLRERVPANAVEAEILADIKRLEQAHGTPAYQGVKADLFRKAYGG